MISISLKKIAVISNKLQRKHMQVILFLLETQVFFFEYGKHKALLVLLTFNKTQSGQPLLNGRLLFPVLLTLVTYVRPLEHGRSSRLNQAIKPKVSVTEMQPTSATY
jgi:hypothetical protein